LKIIPTHGDDVGGAGRDCLRSGRARSDSRLIVPGDAGLGPRGACHTIHTMGATACAALHGRSGHSERGRIDGPGPGKPGKVEPEKYPFFLCTALLVHKKPGVRPEIDVCLGLVDVSVHLHSGRVGTADDHGTGDVKGRRRWGSIVHACSIAGLVHIESPGTAWPVGRDDEREVPISSRSRRRIICLDDIVVGINPLSANAVVVHALCLRENGRAPRKCIALNGSGRVFKGQNSSVRERRRGGELRGLAGGGGLKRRATKILGEDVPACLEIAVLVRDHVPRLERLRVGICFDHNHVDRFAGLESGAGEIDIGIWRVILAIGGEGWLVVRRLVLLG